MHACARKHARERTHTHTVFLHFSILCFRSFVLHKRGGLQERETERRGGEKEEKIAPLSPLGRKNGKGSSFALYLLVGRTRLGRGGEYWCLLYFSLFFAFISFLLLFHLLLLRASSGIISGVDRRLGGLESGRGRRGGGKQEQLKKLIQVAGTNFAVNWYYISCEAEIVICFCCAAGIEPIGFFSKAIGKGRYWRKEYTS